MLFQIAKHFIDSHSVAIKSQGDTPIWQISSQTLGIFLTDFPVDQQVDRINLLGSQAAFSKPDTLTRLIDKATEWLPINGFIEPEQSIRFLTQNIESTPAIHLTQDGHRAEFAVTDKKNGCSFGDQLANIGQQSQLPAGRAVSLDVLDPDPGDGNGSFPVGQAHDQQLMPETNLGAINHQMDLARFRYWASSHSRATGSYRSRTRIAGLSNNLLKRRVVLSNFSVPWIFPAMRLNQTERL